MKIKSLITFVGTNDGNKEKDGAILTVFKSLNFDELYLFWSGKETESENEFSKIAEYVKSKIEQRQKNISVIIHKLEIENPIDHNEIYPKLLELCRSLPKSRDYTGAIASGTPTMQVCWILMAESGDFKIKLIRSNEPKFGRGLITEIKLGTGLPRIQKLEKEIKVFLKDKLKNAPNIILNLQKRQIRINDQLLLVSPIEYSYYIYFIKRAFEEKELLEVDIAIMPEEFYKKILEIHRTSFPQADSNRQISEIYKGINTSTFRSNISKLNKKIAEIIPDDSINQYYQISSQGSRFFKKYGIILSKNKIIIKK